MDNQESQSIESLPMNVNIVIPTPKPDTRSITQLIKHSGRIEGCQFSSGQITSKEQGVELTRTGATRRVVVAMGSGSEYLHSLPDDEEGDNLGNLLSIS